MLCLLLLQQLLLLLHYLDLYEVVEGEEDLADMSLIEHVDVEDGAARGGDARVGELVLHTHDLEVRAPQQHVVEPRLDGWMDDHVDVWKHFSIFALPVTATTGFSSSK